MGRRKLHRPEWYLEYEESLEVKNRKKSQKLKQMYGITLVDMIAMAEAQGGKCSICENPLVFENRGCGVDHCHTTGKVRGVLCKFCNLMLGYSFDNPKILEAGIKYLKNNS